MPTTSTPLKCDRRGREGTLYLNTGDDVSQVWVEHLSLVGDLTIGEVEDDEELETRSATRVYKEYIEGNVDINITGSQTIDENYLGFLFLYAMRSGGNPRDVMVLTNTIDVDGSVGFRGKMRNKDRTFNMPATGAMTQAFSLRPAACTDVSVRPVKVSSSTPADWDPTSYSAPA